MSRKKLPIDLIREIEDTYGTLNVPDSTPLLIKLHKVMGVVPETRDRGAINEQIKEMYLRGYTTTAIVKRLKVTQARASGVADRNHLYIYSKFRYCVNNDFYATKLTNLERWNIKAYNFHDAKVLADKNNIPLVKVSLFLDDLPKGSKYLLPENNTVHIKE